MATDSNPSPTGQDRVDDLLPHTGTRLLVVLITAGVIIALYYDSSFSRENVRLLLYAALALATTDFVDVTAEHFIAKLAATRLDTYLDLSRHARVVDIVVALVSAVLVIFVTFGVSQWSTTNQYHTMLGVLALSLVAHVRLANSKKNSNRPPTPTLYRRDRSERSGAPVFIGPLILTFLLFVAVIIAYFGLLYTIAP
ncbi:MULTISPECIES: hypothetical protein [unclassified Haloferax]|jgi:hypothetical protein|uniref:hypothetical protein n=1 Tax=unclassified Haloferax TaxID=2625095 RepID=UPI00287653C2|nr:MULTISPECIES: hypothetical protein [unclassified Haloferax]MDS0243061.1 hypothetical protein [Haloferax sp. S2CR25]MDS0446182.1 hypothetical protein [Haloferax sp. S2CR25-2]